MTEKIERAIARIRQAYEIAQSHGNDLVIAYSGGKDSDIILELAKDSGVKFKVQHNHTTIDAPETVRHIRAVFAALTKDGIEATVNYPEKIKTADGEERAATMWNLIPVKQIPPTRLARYCCEYFKERRFDGQHIVTGVRWSESPKRKDRGLHETLTKEKEARIVYADENDDAHKLTDICQMRNRVATNPIIDWSDADVWQFIKERGMKINPLYGLGFKRVGCIGCPLAGGKIQRFEFQLYPKIRAAYVRAFDKMIERRRERGQKVDPNWTDGESVLQWWVAKG